MEAPRHAGIAPVTLIFVALAATAGLYLANAIAATLLLVFAGIMFAAVLDAGTRALERVAPVGRLSRLGIVTSLIVASLVAGFAWGGATLVMQARDFAESAAEQFDVLIEWLGNQGLLNDRVDEENSLSDFADLLPSGEVLFDRVQSLFGLLTGLAGSAVVILFLGLFFAANPTGYRDGVCRLVPERKRARLREVLDEAGYSLRWWLVGQLAMMAVVAISLSAMLLLMNVPNAILLGVVAGLLNFIPYLGPILAAVPIFLALLPEGPQTVVVVMTLFVVIQSIEGYLFAPLIQQRAVHLPPALSLAGLLAFGSLFGSIGVALATPILAVLRILVLRLYVEDGLERKKARSL